MPKVSKTASVHPSTVTKLSRSELHDFAEARSYSKTESTLTTWKPDALLWKAIKKMIDNPKHVEHISPTEVIIWNYPKPWPSHKK